jgi:selenium-binding protein 1
MRQHRSRALVVSTAITLLLGLASATLPHRATADESVFVTGLEGGADPSAQETILYVWTRDADGKETDALTVVDVDPESPSFGKILYMAPTGSSANEAHHFGYTASASRIFGGGLFSNKLFIYDLEADPRRPQLLRVVDLDATGYSGPHALYAVPGGVMLAMLGGVGGGGPAGLVQVDDDGQFVAAWPQAGHAGAPDFMDDVGVKPKMNRMITSAWVHPEHAKHAGGPPPGSEGNEVVVWDWQNKKILQVERLDVAPAAVRWLHGDEARGGFINCLTGNSVWYWEDDDGDGRIAFHRVIETGEETGPADLRISYDNRFLYVSLWASGAVQQYDISEPFQPKLIDGVQLPQPNMMKLSPDSKRLYVSNSLLSAVDGDVRFEAWLLHVGPDGMRIDPRFHPDFNGYSPNGPAGPHDMLLKR